MISAIYCLTSWAVFAFCFEMKGDKTEFKAIEYNELVQEVTDDPEILNKK